MLAVGTGQILKGGLVGSLDSEWSKVEKIARIEHEVWSLSQRLAASFGSSTNLTIKQELKMINILELRKSM